MIALVLVGMATTMLATTLARSMAVVADSRLDLIAAAAQRSRIESLRALPGDRCSAPLAGTSTPAAGLVEHWAARQSGATFELTDSVLRATDQPGAPRIVSAQLPCQ